MISVHMVDANIYQVVVEGESETTHRVHMSPTYYRELCGMTVTHEFVVVSAFNFLLEKEPNTAILPEFDIEDINQCFPEFDATLKARLNR